VVSSNLLFNALNLRQMTSNYYMAVLEREAFVGIFVGVAAISADCY
jgi:Mg/Co/Ni transporter MgtE